jgi:hypothetical protein
MYVEFQKFLQTGAGMDDLMEMPELGFTPFCDLPVWKKTYIWTLSILLSPHILLWVVVAILGCVGIGLFDACRGAFNDETVERQIALSTFCSIRVVQPMAWLERIGLL